jgi:predicted phosphoadenosine phosphosulfate sulfurtransferase
MGRIFKKKFTEQTVLEAAQERMSHIYDIFDRVVVSFSGGKDSTVCLQLALEEARKRNRLPLEVVFYDEEAIHPPTIEYVERVRQNPDVKLYWYCLPFKHRNACSRSEQWWYCWDEDAKDRWVRPMPEHAITGFPGFVKGMSIPDLNPLISNDPRQRTAMIVGMRADESMRRYGIVMGKRHDNYIADIKNGVSVVKPIYDWTSPDVWVAPGLFGWDYNRTYDVMAMAGIPLPKQRVCPPFGEEPLRGIWLYAECFPEMWHKMLMRVPGVATAWRYANTELYSFDVKKPDNITWKLYIDQVMLLYNEADQAVIRKSINNLIRRHHKNSKLAITEETPDPISGVCWKELCCIAIRGDLKDRVSGVVRLNADKTLKKMGITLEEARKRYGK